MCDAVLPTQTPFLTFPVRFSVPFFLEPNFSANVNVVLPGCETRDQKPKYYGPWLLENIRKWDEYKGLFSRLDEQAGKTL